MKIKLFKALLLIIIYSNQSFSQISVSGTSTNTSCYGVDDGEITLNVAGGTAPYTYSWVYGYNIPFQGNSNSTIISNVSPSSSDYSFTITDSNNDEGYFSIAVEDTPPVQIEVDSILNTTNGICNGSINISVSGGTLPYSYEWSLLNSFGIPTAQIQDSYDLCIGNYAILIRDNNDCPAETSMLEIGTSYDETITFTDTLNLVIDTCIFDNTSPIDSALIYDYIIVGADSILLNWIFWQAGNPINLNMVVFFETTGSNLVFLETICSGNKSTNSENTYRFYGMFDTETLGLKETKGSIFSLYPNPTTGKATIASPNEVQIEVFNLSGVLIQSTIKKEIDLSQEDKGIYFVKMMTKGEIKTTKLIVK